MEPTELSQADVEFIDNFNAERNNFYPIIFQDYVSCQDKDKKVQERLLLLTPFRLVLVAKGVLGLSVKQSISLTFLKTVTYVSATPTALVLTFVDADSKGTAELQILLPTSQMARSLALQIHSAVTALSQFAPPPVFVFDSITGDEALPSVIDEHEAFLISYLLACDLNDTLPNIQIVDYIMTLISTGSNVFDISKIDPGKKKELGEKDIAAIFAAIKDSNWVDELSLENVLINKSMGSLCSILSSAKRVLQKLVLKNNRFSSKQFETISKALSEGRHALRHLSIVSNELKDAGVKLLTDALATASPLSTLILRDVGMTAKGVAPLCSLLSGGDWPASLQVLDVSDNKIGRKQGSEVFSRLLSSPKFTRLTQLYIRGTDLNLPLIFDELSKNKALISKSLYLVDISGNPWDHNETAPIIDAMGNYFENASALTQFIVRECQLSATQAAAVLEQVFSSAHDKMFVDVDLSQNDFSRNTAPDPKNEGCAAPLSRVFHLSMMPGMGPPSLAVAGLAVDECGMGVQGICGLLDGIKEYPGLRRLSLCRNIKLVKEKERPEPTEPAAKAICELLSVAKNLESLSIDGDSGRPFRYSIHLIFEALAQNTTLKHLSSAWNQIGEVGFTTLCKSLPLNNTLKTLNTDNSGIEFSSLALLMSAAQRNTSLTQWTMTNDYQRLAKTATSLQLAQLKEVEAVIEASLARNRGEEPQDVRYVAAPAGAGSGPTSPHPAAVTRRAPSLAGGSALAISAAAVCPPPPAAAVSASSAPPQAIPQPPTPVAPSALSPSTINNIPVGSVPPPPLGAVGVVASGSGGGSAPQAAGGSVSPPVAPPKLRLEVSPSVTAKSSPVASPVGETPTARQKASTPVPLAVSSPPGSPSVGSNTSATPTAAVNNPPMGTPTAANVARIPPVPSSAAPVPSAPAAGKPTLVRKTTVAPAVKAKSVAPTAVPTDDLDAPPVFGAMPPNAPLVPPQAAPANRAVPSVPSALPVAAAAPSVPAKSKIVKKPAAPAPVAVVSPTATPAQISPVPPPPPAADESTYTCSRCTLINKRTAKKCTACGLPPPLLRTAGSSSSSSDSDDAIPSPLQSPIPPAPAMSPPGAPSAVALAGAKFASRTTTPRNNINGGMQVGPSPRARPPSTPLTPRTPKNDANETVYFVRPSAAEDSERMLIRKGLDYRSSDSEDDGFEKPYALPPSINCLLWTADAQTSAIASPYLVNEVLAKQNQSSDAGVPFKAVKVAWAKAIALKQVTSKFLRQVDACVLAFRSSSWEAAQQMHQQGALWRESNPLPFLLVEIAESPFQKESDLQPDRSTQMYIKKHKVMYCKVFLDAERNVNFGNPEMRIPKFLREALCGYPDTDDDIALDAAEGSDEEDILKARDLKSALLQVAGSSELSSANVKMLVAARAEAARAIARQAIEAEAAERNKALEASEAARLAAEAEAKRRRKAMLQSRYSDGDDSNSDDPKSPIGNKSFKKSPTAKSSAPAPSASSSSSSIPKKPLSAAPTPSVPSAPEGAVKKMPREPGERRPPAPAGAPPAHLLLRKAPSRDVSSANSASVSAAASPRDVGLHIEGEPSPLPRPAPVSRAPSLASSGSSGAAGAGRHASPLASVPEPSPFANAAGSGASFVFVPAQSQPQAQSQAQHQAQQVQQPGAPFHFVPAAPSVPVVATVSSSSSSDSDPDTDSDEEVRPPSQPQPPHVQQRAGEANLAAGMAFVCANCDEENVQATCYCANCDSALCDACWGVVHCTKITRSHTRLSHADWHSRQVAKLLQRFGVPPLPAAP